MNNMDRLGAVLAKRMQRTAEGNKGLGLELGRIKETRREGVDVLDLVSDSLRQTIPQGSYSKLAGVTLTDGARVVVVWLGHEPVVLGRLAST